MSLLTGAIYITGVYLAIVAALNLLPTYSELPLPEEMLTAFQTIMSYMIAWNDILPIDTIIYCASIVLSAQLLIFLWRGSIWIIRLVRGSAS